MSTGMNPQWQCASTEYPSVGQRSDLSAMSELSRRKWHGLILSHLRSGRMTFADIKRETNSCRSRVRCTAGVTNT